MAKAQELLADLKAAGLTVIEESGWETRGSDSWAVGGKPEGIIQHHTAPPNPYPIKKLYDDSAGGQLKANMATHEDGTLYLIAYGRCNYSSGPGSSVVLTQNVRPERPPKANAVTRGLSDDMGGNRHFWNYENSHPGDGSPIPEVQLKAIIDSTIVVCNHFGLTWANIISHASWSRRKIDPKWDGSNRTAIDDIRDGVRFGSEGGEEGMLPLEKGDTGEDVTLLQDRLNQTYGAGLSLNATYDDATVAAVKKYIGKYTGYSKWADGLGVGGKQWSNLTVDLVKKFGGEGAKGDKGDKGDTGASGKITVEGAVNLP